jgi:hypothetical protein
MCWFGIHHRQEEEAGDHCSERNSRESTLDRRRHVRPANISQHFYFFGFRKFVRGLVSTPNPNSAKPRPLGIPA